MEDKISKTKNMLQDISAEPLPAESLLRVLVRSKMAKSPSVRFVQ
jgi:hypothetical protein